nr:hypothetical protein [uncultured Methanolobus sp.]
MDVDIKRGYEILPDNSIIFGIRITNNTETVISDVQVILDCNESIFQLQEDRVLKLGDIQPTIAKTAKFTLKPVTCVHNETIKASIIYHDANREKHMAAVQSKEVHCICPFLRPKAITKNEFFQLSAACYSTDTGMNFEGIDAKKLTSFLMRACARGLNTVDGYTVAEGKVIHLSGRSDDNTRYMLTALLKENEGLTQMMFRAASDKRPGLDGFLNEVVSEVKRLVNTVNSAKDIGFIKNELVTSIMDTVVPRNRNRSGDANSGFSTDVQNTGMQKASSNIPGENDQNHQNRVNADVARMYDSYLKEVENKPEMIISDDAESTASYPPDLFTSDRKIGPFQDIVTTRKRKRIFSAPKRSKKEILKQFFVIAVLMVSAAYLLQNFGIGFLIGEEYSSSSSASAENVVIIFYNAINEGDFTTAFKLCQGQDFLVPASVQMIFNNNGIEAGGIKEFNIVSTTVEDDIAVIESNCTAVTFNIMGKENEPKIIDVYFQLQKSGSNWMITGIAFDQPYEIVSEVPTDLAIVSTGKQATQEVSSNLMVKTIEGVRAKNSADDMSSTVDLLKLKVGLNVGSKPVDMSNVVISITDGTTSNNLIYAGNQKSYASAGNSDGYMDSFSYSASTNLVTLLTGTTSTSNAMFKNSDHYYTVEVIRDEDATFSQSNPVMNTGDLITVFIATTSDSAASRGYSYIGTTEISSLKSSELDLVPRTTVNIVLTPESGAATTADFVSPSSYGVKETVQLYP